MRGATRRQRARRPTFPLARRPSRATLQESGAMRLLAMKLGPRIELAAPTRAGASACRAAFKYAAGLHPVAHQHRPRLLGDDVQGGGSALLARSCKGATRAGEGSPEAPGLARRGAAKHPRRGKMLHRHELRVGGPREVLPAVATLL